MASRSVSLVRSARRARCSRDITVPIGVPSSRVVPSTTVSRWPPMAEAMTGVPQALVSRLARPNG